jgi:ABC-type nitrate/sulfonate/bicarbonate transport system ATPase subunit
MTVLVVTHALDSAFRIADRVAMLRTANGLEPAVVYGFAAFCSETIA